MINLKTELVRKQNYRIALQYYHLFGSDFPHCVFWDAVDKQQDFDHHWADFDRNGDFTNYNRTLPLRLKDWLERHAGMNGNHWRFENIQFQDPHWRYVGFKKKEHAMHFLLKWS